MSTIANIGNALGYDACEAALASGVSLATVYALAAARSVVIVDDAAPASGVYPTVSAASTAVTARPAKRHGSFLAETL